MTLEELTQLCARGTDPSVEIHALTPMMYVAYHVDGERRTPVAGQRGTLQFTSRYAAQSALAGTGLRQATFVHESAYDEMVGQPPAAQSNALREDIVLRRD